MALRQEKYCRKCDSFKSRDSFYLRSGEAGRRGYVHSSCKACHIARVAELDYRGRHPRRSVLCARKYQRNNREKVCAAVAKREADKKLRTPIWADKQAIEAVYEESRRLQETTGVKHEVDHIIPLNSKLVSGLHVQGNLRAIPAKDNLLKRNFFNTEI